MSAIVLIFITNGAQLYAYIDRYYFTNIKIEPINMVRAGFAKSEALINFK